MREVSVEEYLSYAAHKPRLSLNGLQISLEPINAERLISSPEELEDISTTVWSFPRRGSWATHKGDYRGNWAPQIPRALVELYSEPGELVLDPFIGSGTTCIEARLLGRNCIGIDISYDAVILSLHRLYWLEELSRRQRGSQGPTEVERVLNSWSRMYHGDARRLELIDDESVDLIAAHPPYWNIVKYSEGCADGDLSCAETLEEYIDMMRDVVRELYRVLRPGRYVGLLIGDIRVKKHYVPVSHHVLRIALETGFLLKEEVIKVQHKMRTTRKIWGRIKRRDFLLIYHEKLFILRKPRNRRDARSHRLSGAIDRLA